MAPRSSTKKREEAAILSRGGKDFIIPKKEKEELERRGRLGPEQREREAESKRKLEIKNITQKNLDIKKAKNVEEEKRKRETIREQKSEEFKESQLAKKRQDPSRISGLTEEEEKRQASQVGGRKLGKEEAEARGFEPMIREHKFEDQPWGVKLYQEALLTAATAGVSPKLFIMGVKGANVVGAFLKTKIGQSIIKGMGTTATFAGIMTWLASDNIIGTMSIYGRDLVDDVEFNNLDPAIALDKFEEGENFVQTSRSFINWATATNPFLWPFRKIILTNADAAELALLENKARISGTQEIPDETSEPTIPLPPGDLTESL